MIDKLDSIVEKYAELTKKIVDPEVIADNKTWQKLVKEHSSLTPIVEKYEELKRCEKELSENEVLLKQEKDEEMCQLLDEEIESGKERKEKLNEELKILLLPKDENDDKNVIT